MKTCIFFIVLLLSSFFGYSQAPTAQFTAPVLSACAGVPLSFINQSTPGGSAISGYSWDFGDGNFSTEQNPTHAFAYGGTFTIILVTSGANGQADAEVKTGYITIYDLPSSAFTPSGNGCTVPFGVTFNNQGATGSNITYAWSFGNGQTSTLQNPPTVTYSNAGTFTASLTVTNTATTCTSTTTQNIVVSNFAAGINAPASGCVGTPISVTDGSTVGANNWIWSSGAGTTSTIQNPTYTYSTPGTYTITLTSKNTGSGCQSTTSKQIVIHPSPAVSFTANPVVSCAPASVTFTNNSPAGTFAWVYGDGQTATGQNPPPHVYQNEGIYTVQLSMIDVNGCIDTLEIENMIQIKPLIADFQADVRKGCAPLTVQFTDISVSPNPTQSPIVQWLWNFGNGVTYNGQFPPPQIYDLGAYDVTLTVTTLTGCTETLTINEYIEVGYVDHADFSVAPITACARTDVNFTNLSVIGIPHDPADVTYFWNFNDGTSTLENPTHQFTSDTGYFDVTLIVDYRGCKDTITKTDAVYIIAPLSIFNPSQSLFCNPASLPITVQLTDLSKYGLLSDDVYMTWDFGDGASASYDDPDLDNNTNKGSVSHVYNNYGSYTVKQVIHNYTTGCADSTTKQIHISQMEASFALSNDSLCRTGSITASNNSISTHPMNSWYYSSPGATQQVLYSTPNVAYTYIPAGNYTVRMIGYNSVGCVDTMIQPITALEFPAADFTADNLEGCVPFTPDFINQSHPQGNGAPVGTFLWTFLDDNTTATTPNLSATVQHTYMTEDTFDIELVATDYFGCVSEPDTLRIITTKPVAAFTVDSVVCDLEVFSPQNESTGSEPMTYQWFSDGLTNPAIGTNASVNHSYNETPSPNYTHLQHSFWLIVTDKNGCKDTLMQPIDVSLPVAGINYVLSGANVAVDGSFNCPPVFATFADSSESFGEIAEWDWNFGDGKHSVLQNPNNTYVFSGTYSTSLTITDEFGCTSDTVLLNYLSIGGPSAEPSWSISPGVSCSQNIVFDMNNMHSVSDIIWSTGDGQTINDSTHFVHVYPNNTTFTPSVIIIDSLGCEILYPLPEIHIPDNVLNAYFVSNTHEISLAGEFIFTDQSTSTSPIATWQWDFGDGHVITNLTGAPVHYSYTTIGSRVITLKITDVNGCTHEYKITVNVIDDFDIPNVFTPNGNGVNDYFTLMHDMFRFYEIIIVNRWGDVVEHKKNHTGVLLWDGRNKGGEECVDGVYFYKLIGTLFDGNVLEKDGFVTLIRTE